VQASGPPFDPFIYRTSPATFHHVAITLTHVSEKISLINKNLFHCRVRFHPLQEKNAFPAASERFGSAAERAAKRVATRSAGRRSHPIPPFAASQRSRGVAERAASRRRPPM